MTGPDYFSASQFAVVLLTAVGGLLVSALFGSRGLRGCLTTLLGLGVAAAIVSALVSGASPFLERITYNLTNYIFTQVLGAVGFVGGLAGGLLLQRKRLRE